MSSTSDSSSDDDVRSRSATVSPSPSPSGTPLSSPSPRAAYLSAASSAADGTSDGSNWSGSSDDYSSDGSDHGEGRWGEGGEFEYEDDYALDAPSGECGPGPPEIAEWAAGRGMHTSYTRYAVVRAVGRELGLREVRETAGGSAIPVLSLPGSVRYRTITVT